MMDYYQTGHVMNLANSIIGVGVLAMPYCFKQCGIILSILMLFVSSIISRLACHFLLKSAIMARRKTFEFLAFHAFGALGKFIIEIGLIGFLIGTCIAFFVVMGDLGPEIISEITGTKVTSTLRTSVLMALALFCVLPLGLLRNVDSLTGVSKATIGFYCCLVLKIIVASIPRFFSESWFEKVVWWQPKGILQCLPIFSMALFCQTQLFEIYQAIPNASLEKMNNIIRYAVNICTFVYIFVGMFGYIAFFEEPFSGNILLSFKPSIMTDVMKIGFILSVAFSFPLVIFPCRASLYSLLYKNTYPIHEGSSANYIPEGKFKSLTFLIVFVSLVIGVLIPNIELVLGLVGSTIGVMICVLFPVACFICMSPKNTNERILAQMMLFISVIVMVLGTYANLYAIEKINYEHENIDILKPLHVHNDHNNIKKNMIPNTYKPVVIIPEEHNILNRKEETFGARNEEVKEVRHEPPQPVEPVENPVTIKKVHSEIDAKEKNKIVSTSSKIKHIKDAENLLKQPALSDSLNMNIRNMEEVKEKQNPVVEPIQPEEVIVNKLDAKLAIEKQQPAIPNLVNEILKSNSAHRNEEQVPDVKPVLPKKDENLKKAIDDKPVDSVVPQVDFIEKKGNINQNNNLNVPSKNVQQNIDKPASSLPPIKVPNEEVLKKADEVDIEAIKKEETELKEQEKEKPKDAVKNQELIDTLKKQNEVQQELVKQQKELIEVIKQQQQELEKEKQQKEIEKKKAAKHIENIAKKAIESLSVKPDNIDVKPAIDNIKQNEILDSGKVDKKNKKSFPNPAPLSYQLGLNQNKNDVNQNAIKNVQKFMKPNDLPIPLALSDNITLVHNKSPIKWIAKDDKNSQLPDGSEKKINQEANEINGILNDKLSVKNVKAFENEQIQNQNSNSKLGVQLTNENDNSVVNKAEQNKEEVVESFKRDILSDKSDNIRQKREVEITNINNKNIKVDDNDAGICDKASEKLKATKDSTLIEKINKLSDPGLVTVDLNNFGLKNQNMEIKPLKRDLKSVVSAAKK